MFFKKEKRKIVGVDGLNINNKEMIEHTLENLIDISKVKVDLDSKAIYVYYEDSVDDILITNTIEKLGCIVTGIKEEN